MAVPRYTILFTLLSVLTKVALSAICFGKYVGKCFTKKVEI